MSLLGRKTLICLVVAKITMTNNSGTFINHIVSHCLDFASHRGVRVDASNIGYQLHRSAEARGLLMHGQYHPCEDPEVG